MEAPGTKNKALILNDPTLLLWLSLYLRETGTHVTRMHKNDLSHLEQHTIWTMRTFS